MNLFYKKLFFWVVCISFLHLPVSCGTKTSSEDQMAAQLSTEIVQDLTGNILPFWAKLAPDPSGGFYGTLNFDGTPKENAMKGGILNARILWTFSAAYRMLKDEHYLNLANRAQRYFIDHFIDPEYGGSFYTLTATGAPLDMQKNTYQNAFALYGLSEHYRATGNKESLEAAIGVYRKLTVHAFDPEHGGFIESFNREWQMNDVKSPKTMNTNLHMLEALTNLYRVWKDEGLREHLRRQIDVKSHKVLNQETWHERLFFTMDWQNQQEIDSYGHDIELSWLLVEAAEVLGDEAILKETKRIAVNIATVQLAEGMNEKGAMIYEKTGDHYADYLSWWPQTEAVVGFLNAWQISGDKMFLDAAVGVWEWIKKYMIDYDYGEWYAIVNPDGTPQKNRAKADMWRCPYHNGRMGFEIMHRIGRGASAGAPHIKRRSASVSAPKIKPALLTCEYRTNPSVVDVPSPRLSWVNEAVSAEVRGEYQQAYQICVSSSKAKLLKGEADVWDSGKIYASDSYLIAYAGSPLQSGKDYWWRVRVWDSHNSASKWSEPATWGMGIPSPDEWKALWIGAPWQGEAPRKVISALPASFLNRMVHDGFPFYPAPLLRKSFHVKENVVSAKAFVTGLGFFEFYLNGKKVGDDCLIPNLTNFTVRDDVKHDQLPISIDNNFRGYRVMYLVYDVTNLLQKQLNVAGAILGDGFYDTTSRWMASFGSPRFLCQLEITYKDGTKERICSDESWKVKESPIVMNGVFDGEIYDANRETDGWATAACDDSGWKKAILRTPPTGELTAHTAPTDKVVEILQPVSLTKNSAGEYEVDFGVEISGWIRFKEIQGKKGDTLNVKYICESPLGVQQYIFKGSGKESYAPRFTWYVFRKAVISGIKNLTPAMLTAEAVNTDVPVSAEFRTSNALFDQINAIWQRSQLDNMHGGIASDCPHRERAPYTGDGQVACVTVMHNFDAAAFYEKWIRDMRDAQNIETGYVPNGAPWQPGCGGGVPWGAAMNIMPWAFYVHYGDKKMLEDNYLAMQGYVRYLLTWLTKDGTMFSQKTNLHSNKPNYWLNLGDWAPAFNIPSEELVHTFYLWRCADFTARAAKALNKPDDQLYYTTVANDVKAAFHKKFYDTENKTYGDYGSNVFALVMGVPQERYRDVLNTWQKEIVEKYNGHLNTGIYATQFFFETLSAHGLNELAYEAMNKRDFPSYGHWIMQSATVTWEHWNGKSSRNHPMFGGGLTWFYRTLAGINTDENEPGYKHIIIKPELPAQMDYVYYSNRTPYGKVVSEIKRNGNNRMEINVTIPVGSHATLYVPVTKQSIVTESGHPVESAFGLEVSGNETDRLVLKAQQGNYKLAIKD